MGEHDNAILDLKKLLELETDASLKRGHRSDLIRKLFDARRYEEALNESLLPSGTDPDELYHTCRKLWYVIENELGIRCYDELINRESNEAEYYDRRGTVYLALKDINAAISDFRKYLKLEPNASSMWSKLLNTIVFAGKSYDVIMEDIRALDDDVLVSLGNIFSGTKKWEYSVLFYNEAIRRNPSTALNFVRRGRCHLYMNDTDAAVSDFKDFIQKDPDNRKLRLELKDLLLQCEKYAELVDVASILHDETEIASICNELFERNTWENASRCFTEALKRNPGNADSYEKRAICNLSLNRTEQAISDLKNARKIHPLRGFLELFLCGALIDVQRYEEAAEILEYIDRSKNLEFTDNSLEMISKARQIIAASAHGSTIVSNPATVNA